MSGLISSVTSLAENAIGPIAESLLVGFPSQYKTGDVSLPPALYSLALRFPTPPYIPLFLYTFPISPRNISKSFAGMGFTYDVQGPPQSRGVTRIQDIYGESPPVWVIEGTTGQKTHSTDGGLFTGLESILLLQGVISQYYSLNAEQAQSAQNSEYRLEFYDFYTSDFYQVIPIGPQFIRQDVRYPSLLFYRFTLVGIESLAQPITNIIDPIFDTFTQTVNAASQSVTNFASNIYNEYL